MHLNRVQINSDQFPDNDCYPFNQAVFKETDFIDLTAPVTFFVGENGSGKSTLLEAIAHKCSIHIWREFDRTRCDVNPYEMDLYRFLSVEWNNGFVHGAYFSSELFQHFAEYLDEWAASDPKMLEYFGGSSLMTQSHGQSLMSYFKVRYKRKGLYLLDEPETALSPKSQIELLALLQEIGREAYAQFIIASHSPILLACPDAKIFNFDKLPLGHINYEETEHYKIYKNFMNNREDYL